MNLYWEAKKRHPNMLLLFRVGASYELLHQDAATAAKCLNLDLTSRIEQGESVLVTSFSSAALEHCLALLLRAGHRVAICDCDDQPAAHQAPRTLFDNIDCE